MLSDRAKLSSLDNAEVLDTQPEHGLNKLWLPEKKMEKVDGGGRGMRQLG